jgi:hypothetical protein
VEGIGWPLIQIHGVVVDEREQGIGSVLVRISAGTVWNWEARTWRNGGFGCDILAQPGLWFVTLPEMAEKPTVDVHIDHGERAIVTFRRTACQ